MTCFWQGLIKALSVNTTPALLIKHLQDNNQVVKDVLWQTKELSYNERYQHYVAVKNYDASTKNNGYLCSSCDSFLLLVAELFRITIVHDFNNTKIAYEHKNPVKKVQVSSDTGHFWFKHYI